MGASGPVREPQSGAGVEGLPSLPPRMRTVLLVVVFLLAAPAASAQFAIGGQVGDPTGLSLKFGQGRGALLLALGWDLDDSISAEGHYVLRARRLQGTNDVTFFYGPGLYLRDSDGSETDFGVSLGLGLETSLTPDLELYGLLSPRLLLIEETDFDLGGGIGLRLRL